MAKSFESQVEKFVKKTESNWEKTFRGSVLEIFKTIIMRSPVLTGRFISNWTTSLNRASSFVAKGKGKKGDKFSTSTATAVRFAQATTKIAKLGDKVYMVNNLPYANALEKGSSKKAPRGMVRTTLLKWRLEVKKQERRNR